MKNVSGAICSGCLTAVMGPSGAGKSTLFSLLTGKTKRSTGTLLLNGEKGELAMYQKLVGMVPQDDIMLRELTVNDILYHSAKMRLLVSLSKKRKTKTCNDYTQYAGTLINQ